MKLKDGNIYYCATKNLLKKLVKECAKKNYVMSSQINELINSYDHYHKYYIVGHYYCIRECEVIDRKFIILRYDGHDFIEDNFAVGYDNGICINSNRFGLLRFDNVNELNNYIKRIEPYIHKLLVEDMDLFADVIDGDFYKDVFTKINNLTLLEYSKKYLL